MLLLVCSAIDYWSSNFHNYFSNIKITFIWWHWNDIHDILFWTSGRNLFKILWVLKNMANFLPLEFINLLEILLQRTFHNFLIQKGIVKYAIAKTKCLQLLFCTAVWCFPTLYKKQKLFCWVAQCRIS